ncbi:mitochondrial fission ELM1 family protein [Gammaproteobacteria bacterium]|nr:mitochondrial fission ELM1 family protein [Gammaproteobacteria bacterium]
MNVYWFQDLKTGHLKQVQALLDQLKKEIELSITTINCSNYESLPDLLPNENQFNGPSILIGAGHDVYSKILQAKKYLKKYTGKDIFSIAVLRPSYKLNSFDLIVAPEHDFRKRRLPKNVILFQGSLASTSHDPVDENKGIIAIGGPSKHYNFDQEILMNQLHYILSVHPKHEFKIFNSRRTPDALNLKLKNVIDNYPNVKFIHLDSSESDTFQDSLNKSSLKFVTPDSSNLVFEALSAKGQTFLIQIEKSTYTRIFGAQKIRKSMNELVNTKRVGVVSILNKKGGIDISKIENPSLHFEPLAEVEKVSFSIMKFINHQK